MRRALLALALVVSCGPAFAHGASHGLHLHVNPDTAAPGGEVEIAADAAVPVVRLRISFVAGEVTEIRPKEPTKHVLMKLTVPVTTKTGTINVHAEADTTTGKTLRAAAVVKVAR